MFFNHTKNSVCFPNSTFKQSDPGFRRMLVIPRYIERWWTLKLTINECTYRKEQKMRKYFHYTVDTSLVKHFWHSLWNSFRANWEFSNTKPPTMEDFLFYQITNCVSFALKIDFTNLILSSWLLNHFGQEFINWTFKKFIKI